VIRQFDVIKNVDSSTRKRTPYFFVLQSDFMGDAKSVVCAPIRSLTETQRVKKLTISIEIKGQPFWIVFHEMAALPRAHLKNIVENRNDLHEDAIVAIDLIFSGF
jgi:hypothetical protein